MERAILTEELGRSFQEGVMGTEIGSEGAGQITPDDFAVMLGQVHYLFKDDDVIKFLTEHPRLKKLLIGLSHMIRTSRLDNKRVIEEMKLRWKIALRLEILILNKEKDTKSVALFQLLVNYGYAAIEDARNGWRGKLVTEKIKTYRFEGAAKKKKFLGLF